MRRKEVIINVIVWLAILAVASWLVSNISWIE